jgi:hypothetical protein
MTQESRLYRRPEVGARWQTEKEWDWWQRLEPPVQLLLTGAGTGGGPGQLDTRSRMGMEVT